MLKAFYRQLRYLAGAKDDPFHVHVQNRVGKRAVAALEDELRKAILLMPDIMSRISVLWSRLEERSRVKEVGSYFIAYMYNPQDFIPEDEANGLFGYLDDAYLVSLVYDLLTEDLIHSGEYLSKEDEHLRKMVVGFKRKIKSVIPVEAAKIQQMIGEIMVGEDFTFSGLFCVPQKFEK